MEISYEAKMTPDKFSLRLMKGAAESFSYTSFSVTGDDYLVTTLSDGGKERHVLSGSIDGGAAYALAESKIKQYLSEDIEPYLRNLLDEVDRRMINVQIKLNGKELSKNADIVRACTIQGAMEDILNMYHESEVCFQELFSNIKLPNMMAEDVVKLYSALSHHIDGDVVSIMRSSGETETL